MTADGLYPPSPDHSPLQWAFQADVIDYEELLHGIRSEGTFSVYGTLVNKTVAIPAAAIPLGILSLLGFVYPIDSVDQVNLPDCDWR